MKHRIVLALGIIIPLTFSIPLKQAVTGPVVTPVRPGREISAISNYEPIGSTSYIWNIRLYSVKYGDKAALTRIINDVEKNSSQIERNTFEDNMRLYKTVSYYIGKIGNIDMRVHYFRNRLNHCPQTLNELLMQNRNLPKGKQWRLVSVEGSLYHMQGPEGIYNLKFVSADGFREAVYNKSGILLTEKNDPVNMGTFNYAAGIKQKNAHGKYDVSPYLEWGNTYDSVQKGRSEIRRGINTAIILYNKNISNVLSYRKKAAAAMLGKT